MKKEIYRLKPNISAQDFEELEEYGYKTEILQDAVIKFVKQPIDGEAVKFLLTNFYENENWKQKFYLPNKKHFKKQYDLKYRKDGTMVMTPTMEELLTTWVLQIEFEDGWVGFTNVDSGNKMVYYGKGVLDKYCSGEIFTLLSKNLIEVAEIEEEGINN